MIDPAITLALSLVIPGVLLVAITADVLVLCDWVWRCWSMLLED
jgi:hypothetical protein